MYHLQLKLSRDYFTINLIKIMEREERDEMKFSFRVNSLISFSFEGS